MNRSKLTTNTPIWLTILVIGLVSARASIWACERLPSQTVEAVAWQQPTQMDLGHGYQSKLVLYYFTAVGNESCQRLNQTSLLNRDVVNLINEEFLPVKISNEELREGAESSKLIKDLQQKYSIYNFPVLVVTLPNGREIETASAYFGIGAKSLLQFLQRCQKREAYSRGVDYLAHAKYNEAVRAFEAWLGSGTNSKLESMDGALYCALSYRMLGDDRGADNILETTMKGVNRWKEKIWPEPLAEFVLGKIDGDTLLKECDKRSFREPRVYYFIGMLELRKGNTQGALDNFRLAEKDNYTSSEIYNLVDGQLNILNNH